MKTAFYSHPDFSLHRSSTPHPERPERMAAIESAPIEWGRLDSRHFDPASRDDLAACHTHAMIARVHEASKSGFDLDGDTYTNEHSWHVALLAAGAAMQAARDVARGEVKQAFVASRPPGHHAMSRRSMGFCLFNNIALAAKEARKHLERVAILDWDVHHGNGTQEIFEEDGTVYFASLHESPLYPYTGDASERGEGEGRGATRNIPLRAGSGDEEYKRAWKSLEADLEVFRPQMILISAGFDAHAGDPLGHMEVSDEGFAAMARQAKQWATRWCEGRLVLVLEGGYNLQALSGAVASVLKEIDGD